LGIIGEDAARIGARKSIPFPEAMTFAPKIQAVAWASESHSIGGQSRLMAELDASQAEADALKDL